MFAILLGLKNSFKAHAYLLKEVLAIKLRFALYIDLLKLL